MKRYAIGDIHGELGLLRRALAWVDEDRGSDEDYEVVFLGDYIDRGPDSAGVVDLLMQREKEDREECLISTLIAEAEKTGADLDTVVKRGHWEYEREADGKTCFRLSRPKGREWKAMSEALSEAQGLGLANPRDFSAYVFDAQGWIFEGGALWRPRSRWVFIAGNHDDMMVHACSGDDYWIQNWAINGGHEATKSWMRWCDERGLPREYPTEHVKWLANRPIWHRSGKLFFAHANVDPSKLAHEQNRNTLLWDRAYEFWDVRYVQRRPLWSERDDPVLFVHGHTPTKRLPKYLPGVKLNVDTGAVFGGYLTVAAWDDDGAHPRLYRVNKYNADTKVWNDTIKSWE